MAVALLRGSPGAHPGAAMGFSITHPHPFPHLPLETVGSALVWPHPAHRARVPLGAQLCLVLLSRFMGIGLVVCPFLTFTGICSWFQQSTDKPWPLSSHSTSVFISPGVLSPSRHQCCHAGRCWTPTQPQFLALVPQQQHRRKELGWGPAAFGARSPLVQGQSALACGSWAEHHGFVPASSLGWGGRRLSICTGCERDGGSWPVPREHWGLSPSPLQGAGSQT